MATDKDKTIQELREEISLLKEQHHQAIRRLEEKARIEELYTDSQERFKTIFYASKLGNKIINADLQIMQVNDALVELMGYSAQELIGTHILGYAAPEYRNDWYQLQQQLWSKERPSFSLETCLIRKDGSSLFCNVTSILFSDNGQTLGYTIIEDISYRKDTEAALYKNESMLRFIMEHIPQKIFTATPNGEASFFNEQWKEFTGLPLNDIQNWGWTQFIHPDDVESTIRTWEDRIRDGKVFEIQHRFRAKDNNYCWHLTRALPIRDKAEQLILWVGSSTNLDAHKRAEERKDEFISVASHELKTPLTNIKAYNQLLLKSVKSDSPHYSFLKKSSEQIERLHHLVSDLLDVTKINAGKISYNFEEFDFGELLRETVESTQLTTNTHKIILQSGAEVRYKGDRIRIEQVLNNFLTNAIKYSPRADKVIVRSEIDADGIIVSVQDFGIGIEKGNLGRLFDRYYRVDNTSTLYQGLGLGLYIVSEILKRHHGSFWIESEIGKGSTFYFRLPLGEQLEAPGEMTRTAYRDNHIEIRYNKVNKILYADWLGFQTIETVQKGCMLLLELLKKNRCSKILNNNTHVKGTWSEASEWVSGQWFPMMEESGLRYFSWVYSPSRFSQLSADKSVPGHSSGVTVAFFYSLAQAEEWLRKVE